MKRAFIFAAVPFILAAAPPPVAPYFGVPNSGEIYCEVSSQEGAKLNLLGSLGLSEPRSEGKRYPQVTFKLSGLPELTGTFEAQWERDGARFLKVSTDVRKIAVIRYLGSTFMKGYGAVVIEVGATMGGPKTYYTGYCHSTLSTSEPN